MSNQTIEQRLRDEEGISMHKTIIIDRMTSALQRIGAEYGYLTPIKDELSNLGIRNDAIPSQEQE